MRRIRSNRVAFNGRLNVRLNVVSWPSSPLAGSEVPRIERKTSFSLLARRLTSFKQLLLNSSSDSINHFFLSE
jgi:hypothetical protein